jgi:hypothetical protein
VVPVLRARSCPLAEPRPRADGFPGMSVNVGTTHDQPTLWLRI